MRRPAARERMGERGVDRLAGRIEARAVRERDREIGGPEEDAVEARRGQERGPRGEGRAGLDHREGEREAVGLGEVIGGREAREGERAVRPPAARACWRKLYEGCEPP